MKSLGDLLENKRKQSAIWKGVNASMIVEKANEVIVELFGEDVKNQAQVVYYKDNTITLACLSSTIAQEVRLNERKIKSKINEIFGSDTIHKIRYLA